MSEKNQEQRLNIRFYVKICKSASEMLDPLKMAYGERATKNSIIFEWHSWFKGSQVNCVQ